MFGMDLDEDQQLALGQIEHWWRQRSKPYFALGGAAGTGKSTLIGVLCRLWPKIAVGTYTGKAASVLTDKGVRAQTLHRLLYFPRHVCGKGQFSLRKKLADVSGLIVDEASMVGDQLFKDILSFGLPVLFVGDHGQLGPIDSDSDLLRYPDIKLEQNHRQANESPIICAATAFREGQSVEDQQDALGRLTITTKNRFNHFLSPCLQIICGTNNTRHRINRQVRKLLGAKGDLPGPNERLIFLQNNAKYGVSNGQQGICRKILSTSNDWVEMDIELGSGTIISAPCSTKHFLKDAIDNHTDKSVVLADFGYCVTAHKAQGSEWERVLVFEEIFKADPRRWRYTAVTRAKKQLIYCR
jgi:exodeoxyribonuclease-5